MPAPGNEQLAFATDIAKATGLDPRVVYAWTQAEGAYDPNGTGGHNYLNVQASHGGGVGYSGVPEGKSPGGFAQFNSLADAEKETLLWIQHFGNYAGIRATAGQSPQNQIGAIESSPWDTGNYAGDKIGRNFENTYGQNALTGPARAAATGDFSWADSTAQSAADASSVDLGTAPGTKQISQAGHAVVGSISSVEDALKFILSYRFLEIVGGGVLVIIGLVGLMRELGVSVPTPLGALASAATPAPVEGPISEQPRRTQRAAGFEPQSPERDRRKAKARRAASRTAPRDEIPF